jgi:glutamyl-tRNA synthetase
MILGPAGQKLSKRDGAKSVCEYKNEGYLPDALVNYLARLGWSHGDQEIFTRPELENFFTLEAIGKKGAIFDQAKLDWMNGQFLKKMSAEEIFTYIKKNLDPNFGLSYQWSQEILFKTINLFKGRVATVLALMNACDNVSCGPTQQMLLLHKHLLSQDMRKAVQLLLEALENSSLNQEVLKSIAKENNLELVALMQLLRLALIGELTGPGFFDLISIIDQVEASARIVGLLK